MIDTETLIRQVKRNCNISDAKFWGFYSLCGLMLRLRELYRVEREIKPYEKISLSEIGAWITERETLWKDLAEKDFEAVPVNGRIYRPFEVDEMNSVLNTEGLLYGAGYGIHLKPSFFLADLLSREQIDGYDVYIGGREYARDLSDHPAMLQQKKIYVRTDVMKLLLWQRFEELRCKTTKCALTYAFSKYGVFPQEEPSEDIDRRIEHIAYSEAETFIRHELGEAVEGEKIGDAWKDLLTHLVDTRADIFARAAKDILSDTTEQGMLRYIIENRKEGSLGFYIVFLGGMRRTIFPEILEAFQKFMVQGDWEYIEQARAAGYQRATGYVKRLLSAYRGGISDRSLSAYVEREFLERLV